MIIISTDAQSIGHSFTSPLPFNIPQPKFHFFQQVRHRHHYPDRIGIISGMEYVDFTTAMIIGINCYGWEYTIKYVLMPPPPLGELPDRLNPYMCAFENDLELVDDATLVLMEAQ